MSLVVRRRAEFEMQIIRIERPIRKRDLIVIGVIERFRKRVAGPELIAVRQSFLNAQIHRVVEKVYARFEIYHAIRTADYGIIDHADVTAGDKMRSEVMNDIGFKDEVF